MRPLLRLLRPEQWYKNLLVAVPAVFSLSLREPETYPLLAAGFISLSLASSFCYVVNDVLDLEADRAHPTKRLRPLPAGLVSVRAALLAGGLCLAAAAAISTLLGLGFAMCLSGLVILSVAYSTILKSVAVVDVVAVAANYILRSVAGSYLLGVEASPWLYSGIFSLALYLALSKRRAEMVLAGSGARGVLTSYTGEWLNHALSMAASMVIVTYAIYCSVVPLGRRLMPTLPLVVFFLLRYSLALEKGYGEQPHQVIWRDRVCMATALVTSILALLLIYL